jgi:hypothetical protein
MSLHIGMRSHQTLLLTTEENKAESATRWAPQRLDRTSYLQDRSNAGSVVLCSCAGMP